MPLAGPGFDRIGLVAYFESVFVERVHPHLYPESFLLMPGSVLHLESWGSDRVVGLLTPRSLFP